MLDLFLRPMNKYDCCFKDVRVCRSAEGPASDHHLVVTPISLPGHDHNGVRELWPIQSAFTQLLNSARYQPHSALVTRSLKRRVLKPLLEQLKPHDQQYPGLRRNRCTRNQKKAWNLSSPLIRRYGKHT